MKDTSDISKENATTLPMYNYKIICNSNGRYMPI